VEERLDQAAHFFESGDFASGNKLLRDLVLENNPIAHLWLAHNIRFGYGFPASPA
jgi:hypothetical protein